MQMNLRIFRNKKKSWKILSLEHKVFFSLIPPDDDEQFPRGMTIDFSSQRKLMWGKTGEEDEEAIAKKSFPRPILFTITNEGYLCAYNIFNDSQGPIDHIPIKIQDGVFPFKKRTPLGQLPSIFGDQTSKTNEESKKFSFGQGTPTFGSSSDLQKPFGTTSFGSQEKKDDKKEDSKPFSFSGTSTFGSTTFAQSPSSVFGTTSFGSQEKKDDKKEESKPFSFSGTSTFGSTTFGQSSDLQKPFGTGSQDKKR